MFSKLRNKRGLLNLGKKRFENRTVLIVDDNEVDRKVIEKIVTSIGCRAALAENAQSGIEWLQTNNADLILLDCDMPEMNGIEMCDQIKQSEKTKNIPVVFITGVNTPQNVLDCFEADAENYLTKPINSRNLTDQVNSVLDALS